MIQLNRFHIVLFIAAIIGLVVSGIHPADQLTWLLEVLPAVISMILLAATYNRFRFNLFSIQCAV